MKDLSEKIKSNNNSINNIVNDQNEKGNDLQDQKSINNSHNNQNIDYKSNDFKLNVEKIVKDKISTMDLMQNIEIPDWGNAIQKLSNRIHSDLDTIKKDISYKQNTNDCLQANEQLNERIKLIESRNAEMIDSIIKIQKNENNNSIKSDEDNIEY